MKDQIKRDRTERPNILLITTDQQRFDHLGLKGVRGIDTPNLDRLGREGVHFDRAYTSCPICTPARVSLLTGQYPSVHGAYSIGVKADPFPSPTIADRMVAHGYSTALFGKTHFVPRKDEASHVAGIPSPSPEFFRNFHGPYAGFQNVQVSSGHTTNAIPDMHYRVFLEDAGVDYAKWFPDVNGRHDHDAAGPWNIPPEYHDTTWVSGNSIQWIKDRATDDDPWFCWASFQDPHEPFLCPEPWYSSVRQDEIRIFEDASPNEFDDKPPFYGEECASIHMGAGLEPFNDGHGVPSSFRRRKLDEKAFECLRATLGMVAFLDDRVGAIIRTLEETGQADHTLVVFTTDHGEIHGHHGFWHKGLMAYDDCQRIPMLAWGPGLVKKVGTTSAIANLVDLPRTFLSVAGIDIPQGMQGADLSPVLRGETASVQDSTVIELQATCKVYQQTFVTDRYKLIAYRDSDYGELYDMDADPDQYINLWGKAEYSEVKSKLMYRFLQKNMLREGVVKHRKAFA
ncbi:MAG: sulfatase-like hydrolase/transferase [Victivallales bacterium]